MTGCEGRILDSNSTQARAVTVILIIMNIITTPVTSLLNGLVIIAVKAKLRLRSRSNIALACLATTDLFMGVIGQPTFIAVNIAILQARTSNTYCFTTVEGRSHGISQGIAVTPSPDVPRQVYCHKAPVPVYKYGHSNSHSLFVRFFVDCGTTLDCNFFPH